jgi:hypothetical protein
MFSSFVELQLHNCYAGLHMLNHNQQVIMINVMVERKKKPQKACSLTKIMLCQF